MVVKKIVKFFRGYFFGAPGIYKKFWYLLYIFCQAVRQRSYCEVAGICCRYVRWSFLIIIIII